MANLFLDPNDTVELAQALQVFGRREGIETVALQSGVRDAALDANIERIDLPEAAGDVGFTVTADGLEIQHAGATLATIVSLNQATAVRFTDGNVTARQTGATTFTLEGADGSTQTVDMQSSSGVTVPLGNQTSSTGGSGSNGSDDGGTDGGGGTDDGSGGTDGGGDAISGTVRVDGSATSSVPASASTVTVGASGSAGSLDLLGGAGLTIRPASQPDGSAADPGVTVGADAGSPGDVTVAGSGSIVDIGQDTPEQDTEPFLDVGAGLGQGDLWVRRDGEVRLDGPSISLTVGAADAGEDTDTSNVMESSLTIETGGTVAVTGESRATVDLAPNPGGDASVKLRGDASNMSVQGELASVYVAKSGTADLAIDDGASVETMYLGVGGALLPEGAPVEDFATGGVGQVTVDGSGSELLASGGGGRLGQGASLDIGRNGTGSLSVTNGGTVSITSEQNPFPGLQVGDARGADGALTSGTVVVDGSGSEIAVSGGTGSSADPGSSGLIEVGHDNGTGNLTVRNGGSVSNDPAGATFVGVGGANADGSLTVTGGRSSFDAGADLVIAGGVDTVNGETELVADRPGEGSVRVANGGQLTAGQTERDGETDILVGDGGSLQVSREAMLVGDVETGAGGRLEPGDTVGRAIIDGDLDARGETVFEIDGEGNDAFDRIEGTGEATLGGDIVFDFSDRFAPEPGDTFPILAATNGVTLPDNRDVTVDGLPDPLGVELAVQGASIVATVVDTSGTDDGMS